MRGREGEGLSTSEWGDGGGRNPQGVDGGTTKRSMPVHTGSSERPRTSSLLTPRHSRARDHERPRSRSPGREFSRRRHKSAEHRRTSGKSTPTHDRPGLTTGHHGRRDQDVLPSRTAPYEASSWRGMERDDKKSSSGSGGRAPRPWTASSPYFSPIGAPSAPINPPPAGFYTQPPLQSSVSLGSHLESPQAVPETQTQADRGPTTGVAQTPVEAAQVLLTQVAESGGPAIPTLVILDDDVEEQNIKAAAMTSELAKGSTWMEAPLEEVDLTQDVPLSGKRAQSPAESLPATEVIALDGVEAGEEVEQGAGLLSTADEAKVGQKQSLSQVTDLPEPPDALTATTILSPPDDRVTTARQATDTSMPSQKSDGSKNLQGSFRVQGSLPAIEEGKTTGPDMNGRMHVQQDVTSTIKTIVPAWYKHRGLGVSLPGDASRAKKPDWVVSAADQLTRQRGGRRLVKDCVETLLTKVCQPASTERGIPAASPPPWAALALAAQSAPPPPQASNVGSKAAAAAAAWPSVAHKTTPRAALVKGVRLARGRNARDCEPRLLDLAVLMAGGSSQQQQAGTVAGPPGGGGSGPAGLGGGTLLTDTKAPESVLPVFGPGPLDLFRQTRPVHGLDGSGALPSPVDHHQSTGGMPPPQSSAVPSTGVPNDPMEDLRARLTRLLVLQVKLPRKRAQPVVEQRKEGTTSGIEAIERRPSFDHSKSKTHDSVALAKRPENATALQDEQALRKSSSSLSAKHRADLEAAADGLPTNKLGISPPKGKRAATLAAHALLSLAGPGGKKGAAVSTAVSTGAASSDHSGVASKGTQPKKRLSSDATVVDSRKKRRQEVDDDDDVIPIKAATSMPRSASQESLVSLGKSKAGGRLKKAGDLRSYFSPTTENNHKKKEKKTGPDFADASQDPASMQLSSSTPCMSLKRLSAPGSWFTGPSERLEAHARKLPGYSERKRYFETTYRSQIDEVRRHQNK